MTDIAPDPKHFTKAVTELGEKCPVLTTEAIFSDRGIKILEKGVEVNTRLYERLTAHRLAIPIENSLSSAPSVSGQVIRAWGERAMSEVPFFERIAADARTRTVLLDTLGALPLPAPIAFQLTLAREVRPKLFAHSIHMALFAAWLAHGPATLRYDVNMAAAAGLLHDIGMLHIDPILFTPQHLINEAQRRQLYAHALISTMLIERHHEYPRELLRAVREHHEFLNGSGYPQNLRAQAISPLGRILSIGELVTTQLNAGKPAAEQRLSVLLRMNQHRYDEAMTERVLRQLKPEYGLPDDAGDHAADAVSQLLEIDQLLEDWPAQLAIHDGLPKRGKQGLVAVTQHAAQLRRTLAAVGAAPQQLAQLDGDPGDPGLQLELTLLAREAAWQLRALARETRQCWDLQPDTPCPEVLQTWLDRVDALVQAHDGHASQPDQIAEAS